MTLYPLLPLTTCLVTGALAAVILARDPARRANRLAALLVGGGVVWSVCEVLWSVQTDAAAVRRLWQLGAFGWVWIGPLLLHLVLEITGEPMRAACGARCRRSTRPRARSSSWSGARPGCSSAWSAAPLGLGLDASARRLPPSARFTIGCVAAGALGRRPRDARVALPRGARAGARA